MAFKTNKLKRKLEYNDDGEVKSFVIDASKFDIPPINTILMSLTMCPYLEDVRIKYMFAPTFPASKDATDVLVTLYKNCKYLKNIELQNFSISSEALEYIFIFPNIADGFRVSLLDNGIQTLELSLPISAEINVDGKSTVLVLKKLVALELPLKNFSLQADKKTYSNIDELASQILFISKNSLESLTLTSKNGNVGPVSIEQLDACTKLELLSITCGHAVTDRTIMALTKLGLTTLLLSNMHYIYTSVALNVFSHENLKYLTSVRFCFCNSITNEILRELSHNCINLQNVEIASTPVNDEGISYIIECAFLKSLSLSHLSLVKGSFLISCQQKLCSLEYFFFNENGSDIKDPRCLSALEVVRKSRSMHSRHNLVYRH